jgi:glutamine synthetase
LDRYSEECNNYIHQKGLISAPSFNSWGINNRTASVRIPDLKNFRDRTNYSQENKKYKRVEFRVPSSNSCIELVLYGVLTSIYIGLRKDIPDVAMTSNNLFVSKHSYENIYIKEFGFREIEEEDDFF